MEMTKVYSPVKEKDVKKIQEKKNYGSIDLFKFIFSFFVIMLHTGLFLSVNEELEFWFINTISRFAVPFFFASSGFLFFTKLDYKNDKIENSSKNRKKFFRYIWRMFLLYIIWSVIYLFVSIPEWVKNGWLSFGIVKDYVISTFRIYSYYHLWYMIDLIYATIFGYILLSFVKRKYIPYIVIVLYAFGITAYSYYWIDCPASSLSLSAWNSFTAMFAGLTMAFPLMYVGYFASQHNFKKMNSLILTIVSLVLLCVEIYLLRTFTENKWVFSYIIFTLPCAYFLFSLVININVNIKQDTLKILRSMSTLIYCIHPLIINAVYIAFKANGISDIHSVLKYFMVAGLSLVVAFIIVKLSQFKYLKFLKYLY